MKRSIVPIIFVSLSLSLLMPSLSALSRVEPSLPAQQTTQAAATLEEYSGKFTQRLQKIMNCVRGVQTCSKSDITEARVILGIIGAVLTTLTAAGALRWKNVPPFRKTISSNGTQKEEATEEEALKRRQKKQKRTQLSNPEEAVLQQSAPKVTVNQDQQNLIQTIYSTYYVPAIKYNDTSIERNKVISTINQLDENIIDNQWTVNVPDNTFNGFLGDVLSGLKTKFKLQSNEISPLIE